MLREYCPVLESVLIVSPDYSTIVVIHDVLSVNDRYSRTETVCSKLYNLFHVVTARIVYITS